MVIIDKWAGEELRPQIHYGESLRRSVPIPIPIPITFDPESQRRIDLSRGSKPTLKHKTYDNSSSSSFAPIPKPKIPSCCSGCDSDWDSDSDEDVDIPYYAYTASAYEYAEYDRQLYESDGFDLDNFYNLSSLCGRVVPMHIQPTDRERLTFLAQTALRPYNVAYGLDLEVVQIIKANRGHGSGPVYYITFEVKPHGDICSPNQIFQAEVYDPRYDQPHVLLIRPKPNKPRSQRKSAIKAIIDGDADDEEYD